MISEVYRVCARGAATVASVRIATWNVNSVKQRLPRLLPWLDQRKPDVVCLQETKLADDAFVELLGDELSDRGYAFAAHGEAAWNGVAILSRVGLEDVVNGIEGAPGFPNPEARAVSATCDGVRVFRCTCRTGEPPARSTTSTSSPGSRRCGMPLPAGRRTWSCAAT